MIFYKRDAKDVVPYDQNNKYHAKPVGVGAFDNPFFRDAEDASPTIKKGNTKLQGKKQKQRAPTAECDR